MTAKKLACMLVGIGVSLCIIALAMLILINTLVEDGVIGKTLSGDVKDTVGVVALFILIVPAIALFIYSGMKLEKYKYLENDFDLPLQVRTIIEQKHNAFLPTHMLSIIIGDFSKENIENNKIIGAVASIVWPLATCIFLVSGFIFNQWHIGWIVFPITGILFGMFCAAYTTLKATNL